MTPHDDPFCDAPDPARYVPREASERALGEAMRGAAREHAAVLCVAPAGHGKTLWLRLLERRLPAPLRAVYVPNPGLSPAELCAWTLGLAGSPRWADPIAVLSAWAEHLREDGAALVWLIDDAHGLPEETARWLGHAVRSTPALRVVAAALDDAKGPDALAATICIDALVPPMQADETARYVVGRLAQSRLGSELRARCQASLAAIHELSGGVPREVSSACARLIATHERAAG